MRAAIIGLGWWGQQITKVLNSSDAIDIALAVDPDEGRREAHKAIYNLPVAATLEEALADKSIDAVILCTPHSMHTAQVAASAAAGKHVFCEKPLALNPAEAQASVDACKKAGVMLGIGHERRFEPAMAELRKLIREGALGTIMHAEANLSHDKLAQPKPGDWRINPKDSPAAGMTAMGIHLTDLFLDLLGPVTEVHAQVASRVGRHPNGDVVSLLLRFQSGATGYINAILVTPLYIAMRVFGSEAWAEVRNHTHPDTPGPATLTVYRTGKPAEVRDFPWEDSVRYNLEAFAAAVEGKAPYIFTDAQKVGNIAILDAVKRSAESGQSVAI